MPRQQRRQCRKKRNKKKEQIFTVYTYIYIYSRGHIRISREQLPFWDKRKKERNREKERGRTHTQLTHVHKDTHKKAMKVLLLCTLLFTFVPPSSLLHWICEETKETRKKSKEVLGKQKTHKS